MKHYGIVDVYKEFKVYAYKELSKYKVIKRTLEEELTKYFELLAPYADVAKDRFGVDFMSTENSEFINRYNLYKNLYRKAFRCSKDEDYEYRDISLIITAYARCCLKLINAMKHIEVFNRAVNLKTYSFRDKMGWYYIKTHDMILKGKGYRFTSGVGTLAITRIKSDCSKRYKFIDYAATKKRKQELIDKGLEPYDKKKADWCDARGIPYNGIDYRVFANFEYLYKFEFYDSKLFSSKGYKFKTVPTYSEFQGKDKSAEAISKVYDTEEKLNKARLDVNTKLRVLLIIDKLSYNRFIRDIYEQKCKYRSDNSQVG